MAQLLNPSKSTFNPDPPPSHLFTPENVRVFDGGATRDLDDYKLDYEGFLAPSVLQRYAEYMHTHRETAAGPRASDNWQNGIPIVSYMKSLIRHTIDLWRLHRHPFSIASSQIKQQLLCAIMFNAMGHLYELLKCEAEECESVEPCLR
jgi:hypothetical protein